MVQLNYVYQVIIKN